MHRPGFLLFVVALGQLIEIVVAFVLLDDLHQLLHPLVQRLWKRKLLVSRRRCQVFEAQVWRLFDLLVVRVPVLVDAADEIAVVLSRPPNRGSLRVEGAAGNKPEEVVPLDY